MERCVQRNRSARSLNACCCADHVTELNALHSVERGVSAKKEIFIFTHQTVQNQTIVLAIEKNGTGTKVAGSQRANAHAVAVAQRRRHAGAARLKADRRVLLQQAEDDGLIRLGFSGHTEGF